MTRVLRLLLLTVGSIVLQVGHVQELPPESSRFRDPEDGQFDVSSFLEHPRGFLPVPVIITEPAVGYGGGLVGMFLRPRKQAGEQGWARPGDGQALARPRRPVPGRSQLQLLSR